MDPAGISVLQEARSYVQGIFSTKLSPSFVFHNLEHTEGVVKACEEMADYYQLSGEDRLVLLLAAWFHDAGYSYGEAEKHEEAGISIARRFLERYPSVSATLTDRVASAIGSTHMPQAPGNLIEEILCDADLFHLGTADFRTRSKLLRKEINALGRMHYNKEEWKEKNVEFLRKHHYFTSYCRERLEPMKRSNLQELEKKHDHAETTHGSHAGKDLPETNGLQYVGSGGRQEIPAAEGTGGEAIVGEVIVGEAAQHTNGQQTSPELQQVRKADAVSGGQQVYKPYQPDETDESDEMDEHSKKHGKKSGDKNKKTDMEKSDKADKSDKDKAEKSERGITTTFRITSSNHSNLSHMADNKAHILISVNSIIISIIISLLIRHLQEHHNLIIPTTILMIVSVVTMVFSILATRPNVSHGVFTAEDVKNRKVNLLFFGNFFNMSVTEYSSAMKEMIEDRNYMYDNIIKDIYYQGIVLARKYKYLRIAYTIFMYGIILSVLAFSITMFYM